MRDDLAIDSSLSIVIQDCKSINVSRCKE